MHPETISIDDHIFEIFISPERISERVREIASDIEGTFSGKPPLLLCVMNGALYFAADLSRCMKTSCELSSVRLSSYVGMKSGEMKEIDRIDAALVRDRDVIILEDIVDTGKTVRHLTGMLKELNAFNVRLASLLFKKSAGRYNIVPDFAGFEVPDCFFVGYGLDLEQRGRHYPAIYKKI